MNWHDPWEDEDRAWLTRWRGRELAGLRAEERLAMRAEGIDPTEDDWEEDDDSDSEIDDVELGGEA